MKKKILLLLVIGLLFITGCAKDDSSDSNWFKEEYESVNGMKNSKGVAYRNVSIDEDNPMVLSSLEEVVSMIENKETFYLYFGDKYCPWCRLVVESAIKEAKEANISKIYYIDIWDDDINEVVRDKYVVEDGEVKLSIKASDEYYKLLDYFDDFLSDYTLTGEDGEKISVGEKRIYAPNYMYIEDGKIKKLEVGYPLSVDDPYTDLTSELKEEEEKLFQEFFNN